MIEATSRALTRVGIPHLILCGDFPPELVDLPICHIPELDYTGEAHDAIELLLLQAVRDRFGSNECVWHFHNPCLGKNPSLTEAIGSMARQGHALILQHHDFAEDRRPTNYAQIARLPLIYPAAPRIAHACINSRDHTALLAAGLSPEQSHVIANPITVDPIDRRDPHWIFQPVRGIRRKNLGETLLLAAHAPPNACFAISRRPDQPKWQLIHDHWAALALDLQLPVEFNVTDRLPPGKGAEATFTSWLEHSSHFLTTSVSEGFGLTFLEAAALNIPLIGRHLPELETDLRGLSLDHLYTHLLVPSKLIDLELLEAEVSIAMEQSERAYGRATTGIQHTERELIDFGRLPESQQEVVIRKTITQPSVILAETSSSTIPLQDHLARTLSNTEAPPVNLERFHPDQVVAQLIQIRTKLLHAPKQTPESLDQAVLIEHFLSPSRFNILCQ